MGQTQSGCFEIGSLIKTNVISGEKMTIVHGFQLQREQDIKELKTHAGIYRQYIYVKRFAYSLQMQTSMGVDR